LACYRGVLLVGGPGREHVSPCGQTAENVRTCCGVFPWLKITSHPWRSRGGGDFGEAQILKWQVAQALDGLVGGQPPFRTCSNSLRNAAEFTLIVEGRAQIA